MTRQALFVDGGGATWLARWRNRTSTTSHGADTGVVLDVPGTRTFCGNEIETLATTLGEEVTVTLESVPDLHTITLTVLIPTTWVAPTARGTAPSSGQSNYDKGRAVMVLVFARRVEHGSDLSRLSGRHPARE